MADSETLIIDDVPPARIRCSACGASTQSNAKFCWMCGAAAAPLASDPPPEIATATPVDRRESSPTLWLTSWLALPVTAAVIYGMFRYEPFYAVLFGPALMLATIVALLHGTVFHVAVKPTSGGQKAAGVGSSIVVWALTAAGTVAVTIVIIIVVAAILIISLCTGLMEACGIKFAE